MISKRVAYVGPGISGRHTSLAHLARMYGVERDRTIDGLFDRACELAVSSTRVSARVGHRMTHLYYEDVRNPPPDPYLRDEIEWVCSADGFVYVLESQVEVEPRNHYFLERLQRHLEAVGVRWLDKPVVFQANKRDLPGLVPLDAMRAAYARENSAFVASVATRGEGVEQALFELVRLMGERPPE